MNSRGQGQDIFGELKRHYEMEEATNQKGFIFLGRLRKGKFGALIPRAENEIQGSLRDPLFEIAMGEDSIASLASFSS